MHNTALQLMTPHFAQQAEDEAAKKHGSAYTPAQSAYLCAILESIAAETADANGLAHLTEDDALYVTISQATQAEVQLQSW